MSGIKNEEHSNRADIDIDNNEGTSNIESGVNITSCLVIYQKYSSLNFDNIILSEYFSGSGSADFSSVLMDDDFGRALFDDHQRGEFLISGGGESDYLASSEGNHVTIQLN